MTMQEILRYVIEYGSIVLFFIVLFENLNFPGLMAGIVYPLMGILVSYGEYSLFSMTILSIIASLLGSIILYFIGFYLGNRSIRWIKRKFPKSEKSIDKIMFYTDKYGNKGVLICRLLPGIRTIVPLISGTARYNFVEFVLYSSLGISLWNIPLILIGFFTEKTIC